MAAPAPSDRLVAPTGPPVRATQEVKPVSISRSPTGRTFVDFGQNLVGRIRFRVAGEPGTTVTVRHAEVLEHGELGTRPLRLAEPPTATPSAAMEAATSMNGSHVSPSTAFATPNSTAGPARRPWTI